MIQIGTLLLGLLHKEGLKQIWEGIKTRKEDPEVNWQKLEEVEKKL